MNILERLEDVLKPKMNVSDVLEIMPTFGERVEKTEELTVMLSTDADNLKKEAETKIRAAKQKEDRAKRLQKATRAYRSGTK